MGEFQNKLWEWTKSILIALILALFIRAFIVQAYKIPSGSMVPTLPVSYTHLTLPTKRIV